MTVTLLGRRISIFSSNHAAEIRHASLAVEMTGRFSVDMKMGLIHTI